MRVQRRMVLAACTGFWVAGSALPVLAQSETAAEVAAERQLMPCADVLDVVEKTLGETSPEKLRLSAAQFADLRSERSAFEKQVREFLRKQAGSSGDVKIPDKGEAIKRALSRLRKDQAAAVESALRDAAQKRVSDRQFHHEEHTSRDGKTSSSSEHSSSSQSSHSSDRSSDSHSDHSSQNRSDHQSKSDKKSDGGKQTSRSSSSSSTSGSTGTSWKKLDQGQRRKVVRSLLAELPKADRDAITKELKLDDNDRR